MKFTLANLSLATDVANPSFVSISVAIWLTTVYNYGREILPILFGPRGP